MTSPAVVEKVSVDIDLNGGLDESKPEEAIDWTKSFSNVENLVSEGGQYKLRRGATTLSTVDSDSVTLAPLFRLGALQGGLGAVGNGFKLYHLNEGTALPVSKGRLPEFGYTSKKAGSTGAVTNLTGVVGTGKGTTYDWIAYQGQAVNSSGTSISMLYLDILDKLSNQVVKAYYYESAALHLYTAVMVDAQYIHIYQSLSGGSTAPKMFVVNTASLPAASLLVPSFTTFTSGAAGDYVVGAVAIASNSVGLITSSTSNNRIEKFNNSGVTQANAAIAGYDRVSGLDTDGTNFYVIGNTRTNTTPVGMSLTGWFRDYGGASPWVGKASAGTSGSNNLTEATNPPNNGATLNGHTTANFDGTNDRLSHATVNTFLQNGSGASGSTIIALVSADTSSAAGKFLFSNGTVAGAIALSYVTTTGWLVTDNIPAGSAQASERLPISGYNFIAIRWDGTNVSFKVNSKDWQTFAINGTQIGGANPMIVGADSAGANFFDGQLAELITSKTVMTNTEVDDIKAYMESYWGLVL